MKSMSEENVLSVKHRRVERARGKPKFCEECSRTGGDRPYHWHNETRDYDNIDAYTRLCFDCHMRAHGQMKLDEEKVREILVLLRDGMSHPNIAEKYGVGATTVWNIAHRRKWRHVKI